MTIKYSLAHLSALELTPPELVMVAAEAGYHYVGLRLVPVTPGGPAWALWKDRATMAGTQSRMAETGVGVLDVELARLEPDTDVQSFVPCMEAAAELHARHILTQGDDPDLNRLIDNYGRLCDLAAPFGLTCDIEFIPWLRTRDLAAAGALVTAAGRPNGGLMIDTLHFARSGCRLDQIDAYPEDWFHYVQLCDAPAAAPATLDGLIYAAREERLFPGEGELDLLGILNRLPASVVMGIEVPTETLSFTASHEERARLAREAAVRLFARGGYPASRRPELHHEKRP